MLLRFVSETREYKESPILPPQLQCSEQLVKQEVTSIFRIMIILNQTSAQAQMGSPDKPGGIKWTK